MQQVLSFNGWIGCTPDDAADLPPFVSGKVMTVAIYVGTGGDVVLVSENNLAVKFANVPSGAFLPAWARRVNASGTTATDLVACYAR